MEENQGWVCLHRKVLENPIIMKDVDHFAIWCYLLLKATHKSYYSMFGNVKIKLKKGQFITGRKKIAEKLGINESKIERVLKCFESEQQIEQQKNSKCRLITILRWGTYQESEQHFEQQMNNKRTTSEQQMNTNNNETIKQYNNETNKKNNKRIISVGEKKESARGNVAVADSPTLETILSFASPLGIGKEYCKKFFNYYEGIGWVNKNGIAIKNWKNVLQNWFEQDKKEKGILPDWIDKDVKEETMSEAEQENLKERLRKYK